MSLPPPPNLSPSNRDEVPAPDPNAQDRWSVQIATVSGIPIRLHFTFLLMVIYFAAIGIGKGGASQVFFILGIFLCVALHELGHSLTAQRFGYKVLDIVLYPIGGVASIESSPRPRHELWIALAGPAVNVVIALLLGAYLSLTGGTPLLERLLALRGSPGEPLSGGTLTLLFVANISLAVFNLIPAFPMDGGRVLRAVLGLRLGHLLATRIAARIGQAIAIAFGIFAVLNHNFSLAFIALFVFFGARQEMRAEESQELTSEVPVSAAMVRDFHTLSVGDNLGHATEVLIATTQQDFPVVHGDEVVGVLSRNALLRGLAKEGETAYVSGTMDRDVTFAAPNDPLEPFMLDPRGVKRAPVLVREENGHLVGMLTIDNLTEFLTIRQIVQNRQEAR